MYDLRLYIPPEPEGMVMVLKCDYCEEGRGEILRCGNGLRALFEDLGTWKDDKASFICDECIKLNQEKEW